jgi:Na+/melibiose symporter-like transporter
MESAYHWLLLSKYSQVILLSSNKRRRVTSTQKASLNLKNICSLKVRFKTFPFCHYKCLSVCQSVCLYFANSYEIFYCTDIAPVPPSVIWWIPYTANVNNFKRHYNQKLLYAEAAKDGYF